MNKEEECRIRKKMKEYRRTLNMKEGYESRQTKYDEKGRRYEHTEEYIMIKKKKEYEWRRWNNNKEDVR